MWLVKRSVRKIACFGGGGAHASSRSRGQSSKAPSPGELGHTEAPSPTQSSATDLASIPRPKGSQEHRRKMLTVVPAGCFTPVGRGWGWNGHLRLELRLVLIIVVIGPGLRGLIANVAGHLGHGASAEDAGLIWGMWS
jgi:hypothetical protein